MDTLPTVLDMCFPQVKYELNKQDWCFTFPNRSEIWLGGLDDKDRTEKILGKEYASLYYNEISQISWNARNLGLTRLAQVCHYKIDGVERELARKAYYDCNPPSKGHWGYKVFYQNQDPETKQKIKDPENHVKLSMNPRDNPYLPQDYIADLEKQPARMRRRFLEGLYGEVAPNALWSEELLDTWRSTGELPDMQRIVIGVDPSGSGDEDNAANDAIGIVVCGLGTDGVGYVLEDLTVKAGPKTWGNVVTTAFERHAADKVVGEVNYGGAMVEYVIQTTRPRTPFEAVTASRGKVVRAEPISSLAEQGKIRHAGLFPLLEEELCSFTTNGYVGSDSPNRADAMIWGMSALFPGIVRKSLKERQEVRQIVDVDSESQGWLAA